VGEGGESKVIGGMSKSEMPEGNKVAGTQSSPTKKNDKTAYLLLPKTRKKKVRRTNTRCRKAKTGNWGAPKKQLAAQVGSRFEVEERVTAQRGEGESKADPTDGLFVSQKINGLSQSKRREGKKTSRHAPLSKPNEGGGNGLISEGRTLFQEVRQKRRKRSAAEAKKKRISIDNKKHNSGKKKKGPDTAYYFSKGTTKVKEPSAALGAQ